MRVFVAAILASSPVQDGKAAEELKAAWLKVIEWANADKVEEVTRYISGLKITREEFSRVFGEANAAKAYADYEKFWKDLVQEAPKDLARRIKEKRYEIVEITCCDTIDPKDLSGNERSAMDARSDKSVKFYTVRLKAKGETLGYSLICFMKIGDHWRAGFKVGRLIKGE